MFKGRVTKFIVVPICTIEDEDGNPFREERGKPFMVLTGNLPDLKKAAKKLEEVYEREFVSKLNIKAASLKGSSRDRRPSKKLRK